ncbi:hypothetical protein QJQ45_016551, partial [Haematococcus lacustris]
MTSTCGSQQGSQEESKVPWDDSQDELFAELFAQAFAEVQGKTNGAQMGGGGEEEGFWELSNNARVAILKGSLKKNNKMNPTYKASYGPPCI